MAVTTILTSHGLTQEKWESGLYSEYLGSFPFMGLMGTGEEAVIQVKEDLMKAAGDAITIGIAAELSGAGVTGDTTLKGAEEAMSFFDQRIVIDEFRHGVLLRGKMSQKRVAFNLRNTAKSRLVNWLKKKTETDLITALSDITSGRVQGRYLYGAADANWNATAATAEATVDNTADQLSPAMISIAKRKARFGTGIKMRPHQIKSDGRVVAEKFIMFVHSNCARDLVADTQFTAYQNNLVSAGQKTEAPMVTGSDYIGEWDGVLIYANDRVITSLTGAASIKIAHNLLLGAQAAAIVWGERTTWAEDIDDYGHDHGFKVGEIRGIEKLVFSRGTPEDHGVVHVYAAALDDA